MTIYEEIVRATHGLDGWSTNEKGITLANLVLAIRPRVIVEIGVWGGKSLIPMAIAARHIPHTISLPRIVAIDPWKADDSTQGQGGADKEWWGNQDQHDLVYKKFTDTLYRLGLSEYTEVVRMNSDQAPLIRMIDLLHIDGNHGPQAIKDVEKFGPSIPKGGVCVLDDLNWSGGNVGRAAGWLKAHGFLELHPLGTGAVFLRP